MGSPAHPEEHVAGSVAASSVDEVKLQLFGSAHVVQQLQGHVHQLISISNILMACTGKDTPGGVVSEVVV